MLKKADIHPKNVIIMMAYVFVFVFFVFQDAIYSPDSSSYLHANIYRSPGYAIFTKLLQFIFQSYFSFFIVAIQLILGLVAVHFAASKIAKSFQLNYSLKLLCIALLLFPFFPPLYVANNVCSEGLSYPLYLFFFGYSLEILINENKKSFYYLLLSSVLLTLTRGQFLILPLIIVVIYILKWKSSVFNKPHAFKIILLLLIPFMAILMDKSYHKLKDGLFISTPFTFINASASALYVSKAEDVNKFDNDDYKYIFTDCYAFLSKNNWLMSSKERDSYTDYYKHFHKNLGRICNYTLHDRGTAYYLNKGHSIVEARYNVEVAAKNMFPILVKNNFDKWIHLYYSNLVHGFKSQFLLFFIIAILLFSGVKAFFTTNKYILLLLLSSALILSNALIVAFASHSIMRYLFYNYVLFFLIIVSFFKLIKDVRNS